MAQFGGGQMQGPQTGWCDYCHQKPKFPPYNYCGKACGSRAKASGGMPSNAGPIMCKQCGQRPVYKGHEFCGRNCANNWQAMSGHINTGGGYGQPQYGQQSWNPMPPPQMQNPPSNQTQPFQGVTQGGGGIKGIVMGIKSLVSQNQQPQPSQPPQQQQQQQPGPQNPSHMQQIPGQIPPNPSIMISPPITPMSSGMGGPISPGTFGPMSPGTPTPTTPGLNPQYYSPISPASPGIQDPNANSQTNGHHFSPPMYSAGGGSPPNYDPNLDPNADPNNSNYPPLGPPTTCLLNGCNKPVFVDPVTHHPSEYCSQRHREDATHSGQVNPCIMCLKMPRGLNDHFCSRACRDQALSP